MNKFRAIKSILKQLNYILDKKQKRMAIGVFLCITVGSFFELLGVSAIYPFIQSLLTPDELRNEWYIQIITSIFPMDDNKSLMLLLGVGIILLYLIKNGYMLIMIYIQYNFGAKVQRQLSTRLLHSYMIHPYTYFLDVNSAEVLRGINNDVNGVYQILSYLYAILSAILTSAMIAAYLFITDVAMASGVVVLAIVSLILIVFGFQRRMKEMGTKNRSAYAEYTKYAYQSINGIKEIMVTRRKDFFLNHFDQAAEVKRRATLVHSFISNCPSRIIEAVCIGGLIGIVCIRIASGQDASSFVPQLSIFAVAAFSILPSVSKISGHITSLVFYKPSLEATYRNIKEAEKYETEMHQYAVRAEGNDAKEKIINLEEKLEIKDVVYRYPKSEKDVLKETSFSIKKGESVGLIGASGAGKTTMADVILGLLQPQSGNVLLDGHDIFAIPDQWAKIVGYVPQTVFLLDDTVRNNISFGIEPEDVSEENIWKALEQAQLKEFVEQLPKGLDTMVGERGVKFSGGQRQRIAIARALYYNPDILVLDEATSALDTETEAAVMEAIEAMQGLKTMIIIAHRLTTIEKCDKVVEIVDGKAVIRRGSEKEC